MTTSFAERLLDAQRAKGSVVCVGIDPRYDLIPPLVRGDDPSREGRARAFARFGTEICRLVAEHAVAVKPQAAFFETLGAPGAAAYEEVCRVARRCGLLVIADVKRGDIGSTAEAYAEAYLSPPAGERHPISDACTVNPFLGSDGVLPFVTTASAHGGGIFVLVKTSNPSSGELQDLDLGHGTTVADRVAELCRRWNAQRDSSGYGLVGAVVGATYPEHLARLRQILEGSIILIPGYGAQGGSAADVIPGFDVRGEGALVNASRSVTFPWMKPERIPEAWQDAVVEAAARMKRDLADALATRRKEA